MDGLLREIKKRRWVMSNGVQEIDLCYLYEEKCFAVRDPVDGELGKVEALEELAERLGFRYDDY